MEKSVLALILLMKDEAQSVERVIRSAANAVDVVAFVDTGSTDGTPQIARKTCLELNLPLLEQHAEFVDFSSARNLSMELAKAHVHFGLFLSGDEVIHGAEHVRRFCEDNLHHTEKGHNAAFIKVDVGGETVNSIRVARLGSTWRWLEPVHEYLDGGGDFIVETINPTLTRIFHTTTDPARKRTRFYRDLEILHKAYEANPSNPRTVFYLAQTFECLGFYAEAARLYLERSEIWNGWDEERFVAKYRGGRCTLQARLPPLEAQRIFLLAAGMRPTRAEPLIALAEMFLDQDPCAAYWFASRAAALPFPVQDGFVERDAYETRPLYVISRTAFYAGEFAVGEKATQDLLERFPQDIDLRKTLEYYRHRGVPPQKVLDQHDLDTVAQKEQNPPSP